jgi:FtsP/CotA-like multicopper oxidase with cupredoxin domain
MGIINNLARRRFLQKTLTGAVVAAVPQWLFANTGVKNTAATPNFNPDVELEFSAQQAKVAILSKGPATPVQKYYGSVLRGPENTLIQLADNYLGPILNLQKGQKVRVYFTNRLNEPNIIHWHGLHVPQFADGHPMYTIQPGERYIYEFEVKNRAGISFYHSHAHDLTAEQVYRGLAGLILVTDQEESKLELPSAEYDLPLVLQDRRFNSENQLQYLHAMPERILGFLGDTILVNGKPNAEFSVKSRAYRFRTVNGSNSRIYKLGWEDGTPLIAIGSDAGLLPHPEFKPYIMLAPGERVDLWLDFSGRKIGDKLVMYSLPFSGVMPHMYEMMTRHQGGMGQGGMGMMHQALPQGSKYPIATFKVTAKQNDSPKLPEKLVAFQRLTQNHSDNPYTPIPISISMKHMKPTLNGMSFAMDRVMDFERVALGSIKKIKLYHEHGKQTEHQSMGMMSGRHSEQGSAEGGPHNMMAGMAGMMQMAHPIHFHGQQFQVISRNTQSVNAANYETIKHGLIDSGWKDTVLVMPGEEVEIIKPFQDYKGLFLYHCHNLEHEDLGMMRQFLIE